MFDAICRRFPLSHGFTVSLCAAGGAFLTGCGDSSPLRGQYLNTPRPAAAVYSPAGLPVLASPSGPALTPPAEVQAVKHETPAQQSDTQAAKRETLPIPALLSGAQLVPINLDTVFRLAEDQNRQIALARERLNESELARNLAAQSWLPQVYAGGGYYRHEGAIQDFHGGIVRSSYGSLYPNMSVDTEIDLKEATYRRVDATRKIWQDKAEVSKVTNETLLDAATTYIDLLAARRGETVGNELAHYKEELLTRAEKLNTDGSLKFLVEGLKAEIEAHKQALAKLHQQGDAASMKLAYLLGLPHTTQLIPTDQSFSPIDLVDASPPVDDLVSQAVTSGPGVRELEGLLDTISGGIAELEGPKKFLPTLQLNAIEGIFGGDPGSSLSWGERFDLGIQARWNLTEFVTAREKKALAQSKLTQAQITLQDLQAKLTLGVQEGRSAILSGEQQIVTTGEMVKHASETYRLSNLRLTENAPGNSISEVVQAIRGLETGHLNYLQAIRDYNKAQIRLMLLLGPAACAKPKGR